jgi:hypothetical protein
LYHKEKRVNDVKATILRKGSVLSTIIIIIIIVNCNTANRPDIVSKTKKRGNMHTDRCGNTADRNVMQKEAEKK